MKSNDYEYYHTTEKRLKGPQSGNFPMLKTRIFVSITIVETVQPLREIFAKDSAYNSSPTQRSPQPAHGLIQVQRSANAKRGHFSARGQFRGFSTEST